MIHKLPFLRLQALRSLDILSQKKDMIWYWILRVVLHGAQVSIEIGKIIHQCFCSDQEQAAVENQELQEVVVEETC